MKLITKQILKSVVLVLFLALCVLAGSQRITEAAEDQYNIRWEIDRSTVPQVPNEEITLLIAVGEASAITIIDENEDTIPFTYDETKGVVRITTAGTAIDLSFFTNTIGNPLVGSYAPATLKNDYLWAWSHGFDDNANLSGSIDTFQARGWKATLYLIGNYVDRPWTERNLIQVPEIRQLLEDGWGIGNHTYNDINCDFEITDYPKSVLDGQEPLNRLITDSDRPDYIVLGFAAPCFLEGYQPVVQNLRRSGDTTLVYNESGSRVPLALDANSSDEFIEETLVVAFNDEQPIGRDGEIDEGELDETIARIDWVARNSNENRHLWYNSLSHGERGTNTGVENRLGSLVEYVYRTYGPLGTDEVWVAPADEIVSYVQIRDFANIRIASATRNGETLDRTDIRRVPNNTVGNLESSGFLPTRERIEDTPIPIMIEAVAQATPSAQEVVSADHSINEENTAGEEGSEINANNTSGEEAGLLSVAETDSQNRLLLIIIIAAAVGLLVLIGIILAIVRMRGSRR